MKIASINNISAKPYIQQNFKGLWGKDTPLYTSKTADTQHHYFPFNDETPEEIKKALASKTYIADERYYGYDGPSEYIEHVAVKERILPFTKAEWDEYNNKNSSMAKDIKKYIKLTLKHFGLN